MVFGDWVVNLLFIKISSDFIVLGEIRVSLWKHFWNRNYGCELSKICALNQYVSFHWRALNCLNLPY